MPTPVPCSCDGARGSRVDELLAAGARCSVPARGAAVAAGHDVGRRASGGLWRLSHDTSAYQVRLVSVTDIRYRAATRSTGQPSWRLHMATDTQPANTRPPPSSAATASRSPARTAPYAQAANQDMLTATLDGLVARFGLQGEQLGEVAAGAVLKHSRDFNLTREACSAPSCRRETPGLRRAAGLRHRPGGGDPGRQQDRARADRVGHRRRRRHRRPTRRSPSTRTCARCCSSSTGPRRPAPAQGAGRAPARQLVPAIRRTTPSRAPACRWASTGADHRRSGGSPARRRTSWPLRPHHNLAAAYDRGFFDDLVTPVPRPDPRPEPARRLLGREAGQAQAGVRQGAAQPR